MEKNINKITKNIIISLIKFNFSTSYSNSTKPHLLLGQYHDTQKLILQSFDGDSEVDDGGLG